MSDRLPPISAPRFFCGALPQPRLTEQLCQLDAEETRHARKALRLEPGARIELFDGRGGWAPAVLRGYQSGHAICQVQDLQTFERPGPHITVAAAVPKGSRVDDMVDQLSQVGADRLIPMHTSRSVVDPRPAKMDRLARRIVESAKQSGRLFMMDLQPMQTLEQVLHQEAAVRLIAEPDGPGLSQLSRDLKAASDVLLLIGPEGGWAGVELDAARQAGFVPWSIGPNVLRIETAAVAAVAVLRYLIGQG